MAGTPLPDMADLVLATKPHKITPTIDVLNDSAKNYYFLERMLRGRTQDEVVQNGKEIVDMVRLKKHSAAGFYEPNEPLQARGMNVLTQLTAPWRFHQGNFGWTKEQVMLNGGGNVDNYVKLPVVWRAAANQDIWDNLEDEMLWAEPDYENMVNGKMPYSLLTGITSDGMLPSGFTTLMGVSATTETNWRSQYETYSVGSAASQLWSRAGKLWRKLRWRGPRTPQEWFEKTNFQKMTIVTSLDGANQWADLVRSQNDRLTDPGIYEDRTSFANIPIEEVPALTAKAWSYPHYYFIHTDYVFPVWHSEVYMDETDPIPGGQNLPFSYAVFINSYLNLFWRSRKRHGMLVGLV